ncbi:MAG: S-adenosylmethionine decarboxylase [Capsulimonadales bacterium]|nr:S-adenosylmethionine decarboxylase [Capsulimonadales bacterium]
MSAVLTTPVSLPPSSVETYGIHLTLRIADLEPPGALNDPETVKEFLVELVGHIGMRILAGPLVGYEGGTTEKYGTSGVVILYESHAAIHTYPGLGELFLDVFSCKHFDVEDVHTILRRHYRTYRVVEENVQDRGIHWGCNVRSELTRWSDLR